MTLEEVVRLYRALLTHPHDGWRVQNQWAYCLLQDEIAKRMDADGELVQNFFEAVVRNGRG